MKLSVIYDSKTENTKKCAEWIAEGMSKIAGVEAKAFGINDVDEQFVQESKGVVLGSPSYAATMTPDMHAWMLSKGGKLGMAGKLGGAFSTEQFTHGGSTLVIQEMHTIMLVWGMLIYSGGGSKGVPVIHLGPVAVNSNVEPHNGLDKYEANFKIFGERFAEKASEIF
jgi:NAD(P)H dehydrogenase (quinone)